MVTHSRWMCVWREGRTYGGRRGGKRKVRRVYDDQLLVLIVEGGGRSPAGSTIKITKDSMKQWTRAEDKETELVEVTK